MPRIDHNARRRARHGKNRANSGTPRSTTISPTLTNKSPMEGFFKKNPQLKSSDSPTDSMRARSSGRVVLAGPKEPRKPTTTKTPAKTMKVGKPGYNRKTVEVKDKAPQAKRKRRGPPGKRR
jgi:hypothetical protein